MPNKPTVVVAENVWIGQQCRSKTINWTLSTGIYWSEWHFNSLPNDKILDWSKLKAIADDKTKALNMIILVLDTVENILGKAENAGYQHFLLFPQCFQKTYLSGSL